MEQEEFEKRKDEAIKDAEKIFTPIMSDLTDFFNKHKGVISQTGMSFVKHIQVEEDGSYEAYYNMIFNLFDNSEVITVRGNTLKSLHD